MSLVSAILFLVSCFALPSVTCSENTESKGASVVKKVSAEPTSMRYGDPSRHDYPFAKDPTVIRFCKYYYLYYSQSPYDEQHKPSEINKEVANWHCGVARSEDLINWTRISDINLMMTNGQVIGYDAAPCVKIFDGEIYLFYQRRSSSTHENAIWMAKSKDGINFTNVYDVPIFSPSAPWCLPRAIDPEVYRVGDKMVLQFATREFPTHKIQQIGMAVAPYGSDYCPDQWTELSIEGSVFKPQSKWEKECIEGTTVIEIDGVWYMFYAGSYNHRSQQLGLATSTDGYHFTRVDYFEGEPGLFYKLGEAGSWNAAESGHPGVFQDSNGEVYLFFQGKSGNVKGASDPYILSVLKLKFE